MPRSEEETRRDFIDPALQAAGWNTAQVDREYLYRKGRVRLIGEQTTRDQPQFVDYLLRTASGGAALAVVEAKDEAHAVGAGLQQAMAYARDLGVQFSYS